MNGDQKKFKENDASLWHSNYLFNQNYYLQLLKNVLGFFKLKLKIEDDQFGTYKLVNYVISIKIRLKSPN